MKAIPLFPTTAEDLSRSKLFVRALIVLQSKAYVYYSVLGATDIFWTTAIRTAATDGIYVYINPNFFKSLPNDSQRAFLLGHEVGHIVLQHPRRGRFYKNRGFFTMIGSEVIKYLHKLYNKSADKVINADLIAHGLEFIECGILDDNVSRDDIVDAVYLTDYQKEQEKKAEQEEQAESGDDQDAAADESGESEPAESGESSDDASDGSGQSDDEPLDDPVDGDSGQPGDEQDDDAEGDDDVSGAGGDSAGDESDDLDDEYDPLEGSTEEGHDTHLEPHYEGTDDEQEKDAEQDKGEVERKVDDALDAQANGEKQGEQYTPVSKGFEAGGNRHHGGNASSTDWRGELGDLLNRTGNVGEASWSRIHRRRFITLGIVSPVKRGTVHRIAVTIDISYSVSTVARDAYLVELACLIDHINPSAGTIVLFTNTEVVDTAEVFSGAELLDLEIPAGGGTVLSSAVTYLEENGLDCDLHMCFTDGLFAPSEYESLANSGVVVVLDRYPTAYYQQLIDHSGLHIIVASDAPLAA